MLRFSPERLEAFRSQQQKAFVDEIVKHLQVFAPRPCQAMGPEAVRVLINAGIIKAQGYGFTLRGPTRFFLELTLMLGHQFDTDPLIPQVRKILNDATTPDEMQRAMHMHAQVQKYLETVVGPKQRIMRKALKRLRETSPQLTPAYGETFADVLIARLYAIYPEKCDYIGEKVMRALVPQAQMYAASLDLDTHEGHGVVYGLIFNFGHGFATDPQYPWIAHTLKKTFGQPPEQRAKRLHQRSMLFLDQALS